MGNQPTPEQVAWMLSRRDDDITDNILACSIVCYVCATFFVTLRLWSRRVLHGRLRLEISDWCAVLAWVAYLPYSVVLAMLSRFGGGRHLVFVTNPRMFGILTIIDESLYAIVLGFLKIGVMSLYRQIFGSSKPFVVATWVITAVVIEWMAQITIATNLQCIPLRGVWDTTANATCINYGAESLAAYILNIVTDLCILTLPIPLVLKLNTSKTKKRGLIAAFAAGGSACIVSLVQLAYITKLGTSTDPSWEIIPASMLADVEIMVGFLATSIATYRPLFRFLFQGSGSTARGASSNAKSYRPQRYFEGYQGHSASAFADNAKLTNVDSDRSRNQITVTDQIELSRYNFEKGSWIKVDDES